MQKFRLGGFIILKSRENYYHVVFDREVSWTENMRVVAWIALLSKLENLKKLFLMQCTKESSTLRVSPKKQKPSPKIVYRYVDQASQIQDFLGYRRRIKNILLG